MLHLLATMAVVSTGPIDGLCLHYSRGGDNPCKMWTNNSAVYIYDGHNMHMFNRRFMGVYVYSLNGEDNGHQLCSHKKKSFNCLFGVKFEANEN